MLGNWQKRGSRAEQHKPRRNQRVVRKSNQGSRAQTELQPKAGADGGRSHAESLAEGTMAMTDRDGAISIWDPGTDGELKNDCNGIGDHGRGIAMNNRGGVREPEDYGDNVETEDRG